MAIVKQGLDNSPGKGHMIGLLIALKNIIATVNNIVMIGNFWKTYQDFLVELGVRIGHNLFPEFAGYPDGSPVTMNEELQLSAEILKGYATSMTTLIGNLYHYKSFTFLANLCKHEALMEVMFNIMTVVPKGGSQIHQCIFSTSDNEKLNDTMNKAKHSILETLYPVTKYLVKTAPMKTLQKLAYWAN
jgi:hypothetical protein